MRACLSSMLNWSASVSSYTWKARNTRMVVLGTPLPSNSFDTQIARRCQTYMQEAPWHSHESTQSGKLASGQEQRVACIPDQSTCINDVACGFNACDAQDQ